MSPRLKYKEVRKEFKSQSSTVVALDRVSFEIQEGELFCLLGPSGCGKTTLLRCTAGLESIDGGKILYGDVDFSTIPPFRRNIGMVFQSYALYPHLSVFENVAYPLRVRKMSKRETTRRVRDIMTLVGLPEVLERNPSELSGGQQQRVALARALVYEPQLLLLDEPLANLDAKLKVYMRAEIRRIQKAAGVTTIYVTHDQLEAMAIGDRLAIMEAGHVRQIGSPSEIYEEPANEFVAGFIGEMNFFTGQVERLDGRVMKLRIGPCVKSVRMQEGRVVQGNQVTVALRPQHLEIVTPDDANETECFEGEVQVIQFLGKYVRYQVLVTHEGNPLSIEVDMNESVKGIKEGDHVFVTFHETDALVYNNNRERIA